MSRIFIRVNNSNLEIRCFEYQNTLTVKLTLSNFIVAGIILNQPSNSPRGRFLKQLLAKRKIIKQFDSSPHFLIREAYKEDPQLFKLASLIPPNSKVWERALEKLNNDCSLKELIDFLELEALAEGLKNLEVII